ncbi:MAG: alpha/beta fold hydrolase [Phycisphaerae bacterium]|nr:alpha/beta fold hydrolase [Phycisphaerae bacterium]
MKTLRSILGFGFLLTVCGCTGCDKEHDAQRILVHDTSSGKIGLALMGKPENLIREGRIDAHVRVKTTDRVVIDVWLLRHKGLQFRGTVVVLHGWLNSKVQNLGVGEALAKQGFDVVLPDHRAHGASTGQFITWGAKESHDVKDVVDALLKKKLIREPLYVWGVSMGGATAILYGALDPRCRGVFAVAPYRDGREITRNLLPFDSDEDFQAAWDYAGKIAKFDPAETDVLAAARKLRCPIIIAHGMLDSIVPYENGKSLHEAAPEPKKLITVPAASHSTILLKGANWFAEQFLQLETLQPPTTTTAPVK